MRPITINDVARAAGVSTKTVSRVLNGEPHVRQEIRDRVAATARDLDYRPNASARALAGARSYLIGMYLNNPSRSYLSQVEQGAMRACRQAGYHLLVEDISGDGAALRSRIAQLHGAVRLDGVVLTPPLSNNANALAELDTQGVPYVLIAPGPQTGAAAAPQVVIDDRQAALEMTRRLLGLGHRRIAFLAGPEGHAAAATRREGYLAALREAGVAPEPSWTMRGDYTFPSGQAAAETLLALEPRPTAIFAANDDMALGVLAVAQRLKLDVPRALSVAGFDDTPSAEMVWPALATVRQPIEDMAAAAVDLLVQALRRPAPAGAETQRLDFDLVMRGSVGPAPVS